MNYNVSDISKAIQRVFDLGLEPEYILLDSSKLVNTPMEIALRSSGSLKVQADRLFGFPCKSSNVFLVIPKGGCLGVWDE